MHDRVHPLAALVSDFFFLLLLSSAFSDTRQMPDDAVPETGEHTEGKADVKYGADEVAKFGHMFLVLLFLCSCIVFSHHFHCFSA